MNGKLIILISILAGILIDYIIAFVSNKPKKKRIIVSRLRIHHSMLGLLFILVGLFINFYSYILIGFGEGIVLGHTIRAAKLIVIEKQKRKKK